MSQPSKSPAALNAKDLVALVEQAPTPGAGVSEALVTLIGNAADRAKRLNRVSSQVAEFRQAHQLWKSVCQQLTKKNPEKYPEGMENLLPETVKRELPVLFGACALHNAFLGYQPV